MDFWKRIFRKGDAPTASGIAAALDRGDIDPLLRQLLQIFTAINSLQAMQLPAEIRAIAAEMSTQATALRRSMDDLGPGGTDRRIMSVDPAVIAKALGTLSSLNDKAVKLALGRPELSTFRSIRASIHLALPALMPPHIRRLHPDFRT